MPTPSSAASPGATTDPGRRALLRLAALAPLAACPPATAQPRLPDTLYVSMAIVTGYDMRSRPAGFAACLTDVLVKVTGDPSLAADSRVIAERRHAADYVTRFDYVDPIANIRHHDDQGTYDRSYNLTVRFDRRKIDRLIASLGRHPWTGDRPVVIPVLQMTSAVGPWAGDFVLTADEPRGTAQRAAFVNAATKYGMPVQLPHATEVAAFTASADTAAAPARMVVTGSLMFRLEDFGWTGSWRTRWHGGMHLAAVKGVSFDTAFDVLVRGSAALASGTGRFG